MFICWMRVLVTTQLKYTAYTRKRQKQWGGGDKNNLSLPNKLEI